MDKKQLLHLIACAGYDIGFGAKKHFATFDIIEKGPGWLGFISLVGGIYGLFVPWLTTQHAAAAFIIFGVVSLYIGLYGSEKAKYEEAGKVFTKAFHDLHTLFRTVQSQADTADMTRFLAQLESIRSSVLSVGISKQIFLSDWYAHFKFFWQAQVDWIDEARPFRFFRDKIPLSAYLALSLALVAVGLAYKKVHCQAQSEGIEVTRNQPLPAAPSPLLGANR